MTKRRSFKDLLFDLYEDDIFNELSSFLEGAPERAELKDCDYLDGVELYGFTIKFVNIENRPDSEIHFEAVVETELIVTAKTKKYGIEENMDSQWFNLDCTANLENGLRNFEIHDIEVYSRIRKSENPLSDSLVPIFCHDELDNRANEFLALYYPDALEQPIPIDIDVLANHLGVTIKAAHLSYDCSIFGMTVFADTSVQVMDKAIQRLVSCPVSAGTVFYDPNVFFMRTLGSVRNTIVHECVHWVYHRKAMELERLFNQAATDIRCQVQEVSSSRLRDNRRNPLDWMEWHANALAPRILMPNEMFAKKATEIIQSYMDYRQTQRISVFIEEVVQELADFFQVSRLSAKLRLIDIGYEEARGAFDYQNDEYVPSYAFKIGSISGNQSLTLSAIDLAYVYASESLKGGKFKDLFDQGKLKYVEGSVCLNDPKYIAQHDNGRFSLTDYARQHKDECCLKFDLAFKTTATFGTTSKTALYRKRIKDLIPEISFNAVENGQILEQAESNIRIGAQAQAVSQLLKVLPGSFSESLIMIMKVYGVTNESLAKKAGCVPKTIQRYRRNDNKLKDQDTVINICVALKLPLPLAENLLEKAGCPLGINERDIIIKTVLANGNYADELDFNVQYSAALNSIPEK